jgi:hypothetical protein
MDDALVTANKTVIAVNAEQRSWPRFGLALLICIYIIVCCTFGNAPPSGGFFVSPIQRKPDVRHHQHDSRNPHHRKVEIPPNMPLRVGNLTEAMITARDAGALRVMDGDETLEERRADIKAIESFKL